jgi:RimJ/RimL family protein N-acetyltransferase
MIKIRHADASDEKDILKWKNDKLSVQNSLSKKIVSKYDHKKWFEAQLSKKPCPILIAYNNNKKIGMVRFDDQEGVFVVSINLNPKFRGLGFGVEILLEAEKFFCDQSVKIHAYVQSDNFASIKLFKKCGYNLKSEDSDSSELIFKKAISI